MTAKDLITVASLAWVGSLVVVFVAFVVEEYIAYRRRRALKDD